MCRCIHQGANARSVNTRGWSGIISAMNAATEPGSAETAAQPHSSQYDVRLHAAKHTGDYVFSQLIPYLGNKRKLLPLIAEAVSLTGETSPTFADMFAGSGVVSRWAKRSGYRTVSNDWEPYCAPLGQCYIALDSAPVRGQELINALNDLPGDPHNYLAQHYCPADDSAPRPNEERCFFTRANGARLGAMRDAIHEWDLRGDLSPSLKAYLVAPLLYAASYVSNTSGVFKAYHHGWGGTTATALHRILSDVRLVEPVLWDNGRANLGVCMNALDLAGNWHDIAGGPLDIAYLDPPYNQHPYGSNYHLLNTLALWDKPDVAAMQKGTKSAIRTDWRTIRRSAYNHAAGALTALTGLVDALPARWVVISYSTDGNIPAHKLLAMLAERGETHLLPQRYKRYRVSTPRMSPRPHTVEFVAILNKDTTQHRHESFRAMSLDEMLAVIEREVAAPG